MDEIHVAGQTVTASTPEGISASLPVPAFVQRLKSNGDPFADVLWADGVKHVWHEGPLAVVLYERPAGLLYPIKWIREDSPRPFGLGATYHENLCLAFPYLVLFVTFAIHSREIGWRLTQRSEVFFRREPLASLDDTLLLPGLPNAVKFRSDVPGEIAVDGKNLSWLCSQRLSIKELDLLPLARRVRQSVAALVEHLLFSGFTMSAEGHYPGEECSWWTESCRRAIDPRITSPLRWQKASKQDPRWVLDVPWIPLEGHTVRQVAQRIFAQYSPKAPPLETSQDLARLVFHPAADETPRYPHRLWPTDS